MVVLAGQFRLLAIGTGSPFGYTVRKLAAVVPVTVTFITTALTPVSGTPEPPVLVTSTGSHGAGAPWGGVPADVAGDVPRLEDALGPTGS